MFCTFSNDLLKTLSPITAPGNLGSQVRQAVKRFLDPGEQLIRNNSCNNGEVQPKSTTIRFLLSSRIQLIFLINREHFNVGHFIVLLLICTRLSYQAMIFLASRTVTFLPQAHPQKQLLL